MTDGYNNDDYDYDFDREDAAAEARAANKYKWALLCNPDCRDPDHPGCEDCEDDEGL
jgi:hypothetical protein